MISFHIISIIELEEIFKQLRPSHCSDKSIVLPDYKSQLAVFKTNAKKIF